jgi:hypothetical protein
MPITVRPTSADIVSVATRLPPQLNGIWAVGAMLGLTRVVRLAHWANDVAIGLDQALRPLIAVGRTQTGQSPGG